MTELTSHEIIKLIENLIGDTEPRCDEALDRQAAKANEKVVDVGDWCLGTLYRSAKYCERLEASAHKIGFDAKCALMDWATWINAVLGSLDGE